MPSNATALTSLLLAERQSLMRVVQRIVGSEAAAEDVAQSLWLKVRRIEDDPPIANLRAFLFRLASNLAIDHIRSENARAAVQAECRAFLLATPEPPSPEQQLLASDELARVLRAAEQLPEPGRGMFRLHRFGGKTQAEVAAHYRVSVTTVEKHLRRAMAALRAARDAA